MNIPKFDLKNKVTYNYRKLIMEKPVQNVQITKENKNSSNLVKSQVKIQEKKTTASDKNDEIKSSILIQMGNELMTPFKIKLRKRNTRLSFYKSTPINEVNNDNINQNDNKDDEENISFLLMKAKTKDNLSNSNSIIHHNKNEMTKTVKNNYRIVVDASKKRENEFSRLIENNGNIEKNLFENDGISLTISNEIACKHVGLIENWIDLENVISNFKKGDRK